MKAYQSMTKKLAPTNLYTAAPGKALDPLTREFAKLVLSKEGQEVVVKDGYVTLPELPGIGFEGKSDLRTEMQALAA